ncbi:MAG: hypothetical protein U9N45_07890, partial [Gemmatimonadota bacterium]|nr:hypothetical protein [Gemmatimonadota bacterium]
MQPRRFELIRRALPAIIVLALVVLIGCSAHAGTTVVHMEKQTGTPAERQQADEFVGTPIMGDYDENEDLDFVLEVAEGDRVFKITVHEDAGAGNRELLERIRKRVNEMEDRNSLRVIGFYNSEYMGREKEYGFLDLKCIVFFDDDTGHEEAFFTDPKESTFYDSGDVTVIYAPGHHYSSIHYPRYVSPWWDSDGDGIPNRYDPWPLSYDTWYDYNLNCIPDWYDPYYCSYYPYWNHWNMGFWVDYGWYSPVYFRHRYSTGVYYDNYRTYSRLYDVRHVGRTESREHYRLDVKTEAHWRMANRGTDRGGTDLARATRVASEYRGRGYRERPPDGRMLVPV